MLLHVAVHYRILIHAEIAHSLAEHVGEIHSHLVVTMPLCLLIGLPLCWYYNDMSYVEHIYDMLFELPLSRKQEVS